jgi:hypothetical protein
MESTPAICPRCRTTETIEHNGGHWCPRCGRFAIPPDPRYTANLPDRPPPKHREEPDFLPGDYYDDELGKWFIYHDPE